MTYYVITSANSINNTTPSTYLSARDIGEGDNLLVDKTGYILSTGAGTDAVYVNAYATNAVVTVDGLISGTRTGIYSLGQYAMIYVNGHVVGSEGIRVENGGNVTISGTGVVSGGMTMSGGGLLINNGEIDSTGSWGVQLAGSSIINNGMIISSFEGIFFDGESVGRITNNGTIQGDLYTWYGATDPAAHLTVSNSGDWIGDIGMAPGDDTLTNSGKIDGSVTLGAGNDTLDSRYGLITGNISAGAGNDTIRAGAADDTIDGGAGADIINGGGGQNAVSYGSSLVGVKVDLLAGIAKSGDAAGDKLTRIQDITGTLQRDVLVGDDSANLLFGVLGRDKLVGNGGNDSFQMYGGGNADISGGTGNDYIQLLTAAADTYGFAFSAANKIDGGIGYDTLDITNSGPVALKATTLINVERILVEDGYDYSLTTVDATVAKGKVLELDAGALTGAYKLQFDGSAEKNGRFEFDGGAGNDVFKGGAGADTVAGNGGGDVMTGGGGADIFVFNAVADSVFATLDRITDFKAGTDKFELDVAVSGIDAGVSGSVTASADLEGLLTGHLAAHHAVLVKVNAGGLVGHTLLVVDADGVAGYDAAADYVVDVKVAGSLAVGDFFS